MNLGSEIRVFQGLETHFKQQRYFAGSRASMSVTISSGRFAPVSACTFPDLSIGVDCSNRKCNCKVVVNLMRV